MKSIRCTVLLLCAMLVIASLDAMPDPPAVNPQSTNLKAPCLRECARTFYEQRLDSNPLGVSSDRRIWFLAFANDHKPGRPSDSIVLTGQAADPSPPAV